MNAYFLLLALGASASPVTDFGVRVVGREVSPAAERSVGQQQSEIRSQFSLNSAAAVIARYGRVTSTLRSPERNRRVGGVPNSWHLRGRAIDVVRSREVSHAALASELRRRGFHLSESLDEGDHSHFAFSDGKIRHHSRNSADQLAEVKGEASYFQFVEVPSYGSTRRKMARR
jgi:hypothetical protein